MKDFYCYIHIEKCAGTTLHHSIKYNLPCYLTLKPWYYWTNEPDNYMSANELRFIKMLVPFVQGIGGHTTRTFAGYEKVIPKKIQYFTFLRDPISRYMSHFNHQVNKMNKEWTIESFSSESRFDNYMTVRIAGKSDLDLAIERLEKDFKFVGLIGKYDESILLLNQIIFNGKVNLHYEYKNDSENEEKINFIDLCPELKKKIEINNSLDTQLYQYAKNEIYPKFIEAYEGDLAANIKLFKEVNKKYRYNRLRYYLIKGTRLYTEKIAEKIAHRLYLLTCSS